MKLKELLKDIVATPIVIDVNINGLCIDSRQLKPGDLFFAYPGVHRDRRQFIAEAVEVGAAAILVEVADQPDLPEHVGIPLIPVMNLRDKAGEIASRFYGEPSKKLTVVGVTGTNGKSSVVHLAAQALELLGKRSAAISTIVASQTTPDALTIQSMLAEYVQQGIEYALIEVSSHALVQGRVNGVAFDYAVFTNLTRDHLDYHGDMKAYALAKYRLFTFPMLKAAVINEDDPLGAEWITNISSVLPVCSYSTHDVHPQANVAASNIELTLEGVRAQLKTPWGEGELISQLVGEFNLSNLLAVIGVLSEIGVVLESVLAVIPQLEPISGRMQTLGGGEQPLVVLDYAHTPDALAQALSSLAKHCHGRLICLFGCGGNRDRGKRAQMAKVAENYADVIVLTDDNPRTESPEQIIQDILQGFACPEKIHVENNRELAIKFAVQQADVGDMILLAGKGHECYQDIQGVKHPFDERAIVRGMLRC
jgi:UDP-N-acetylmuramoyl-L-alanyl-D-glutamate--2,6-diaminopimelate ligase